MGGRGSSPMCWLGAAVLASASLWGSKLSLWTPPSTGGRGVYASFDAFDDEVVVYGWAPAPMTLTVRTVVPESFRRPHGGGHQPVVFCGVS